MELQILRMKGIKLGDKSFSQMCSEEFLRRFIYFVSTVRTTQTKIGRLLTVKRELLPTRANMQAGFPIQKFYRKVDWSNTEDYHAHSFAYERVVGTRT